MEHEHEATHPAAEIDAMIADLEAEDAPEIRWAIDNLREARAEVDELDELQNIYEERLHGVWLELREQIRRADGVLASGGVPSRRRQSATNLDREADRVAEGRTRAELTPEQRDAEVRRLRLAAQVVRDRAALRQRIAEAATEFSERMAAYAEKDHQRMAEARKHVRDAGAGTAVWRMNQQRRREGGRGPNKK